MGRLAVFRSISRRVNHVSHTIRLAIAAPPPRSIQSSTPPSQSIARSTDLAAIAQRQHSADGIIRSDPPTQSAIELPRTTSQPLELDQPPVRSSNTTGQSRAAQHLNLSLNFRRFTLNFAVLFPAILPPSGLGIVSNPVSRLTPRGGQGKPPRPTLPDSHPPDSHPSRQPSISPAPRCGNIPGARRFSTVLRYLRALPETLEKCSVCCFWGQSGHAKIRAACTHCSP